MEGLWGRTGRAVNAKGRQEAHHGGTEKRHGESSIDLPVIAARDGAPLISVVPGKHPMGDITWDGLLDPRSRRVLRWWVAVHAAALPLNLLAGYLRARFEGIVAPGWCGLFMAILGRPFLLLPVVAMLHLLPPHRVRWKPWIVIWDAVAGGLWLVFLPLLDIPATPGCGPLCLALTMWVVLGGVAAGFTLAAQLRGLTLKRALQRRGYHWITHAQAAELWGLCGDAACGLPPWEDAGVLPGVCEGRVETLRHAIRGVGSA